MAVLKKLPNTCVDTVITSPPYFQQRDYNGVGVGRESSIDGYLETLYEGFNEILRILKPTGNIFYNIGDKISKEKGSLLIPYRFALGVLETYPTLQLVNDITWIKKNPTPRQFNRRLVSSTEPFFHFVKSNEYYYDLNNYMISDEKKTPKTTNKLGAKYFEIIDTSKLTASEKKIAKQALTDTIDEVKSEKIKGFRMKIRGHHAPAFGGQDGGRKTQIDKQGFTIIKLKGNSLKKNYIETPVEVVRNVRIKHPAIYPVKIIEELIKLSCPVNGIVLDLYCGSGTTLVAAKRQNRKYIGIEISPEYCQLSQIRVNNDA